MMNVTAPAKEWGPQVGEAWGYRHHAGDPLIRVVVEELPEGRPPRALVRYEKPKAESELVPVTRLKVPWSEAGEFAAQEERWASALAASDSADPSEVRAAGLVVGEIVPREVASVPWRETVLVVYDQAELEKLTGLSAQELDDRLAFADGDTRIAPWPVLERVAHRLVERFSDRLMEYVTERDREEELQAVHGYYSGRTWISPEVCRQTDAEDALARSVLRRWLGDEAKDRWDELEMLRAEVRRVDDLLRRAVTELRQRYAAHVADRIERELGAKIAPDR